MAEMYGWTLDAIDGLSHEARERVRRLWATNATVTRAERYLADWRQKNSVGTVDRLRAMFGGKR